MAESERQKYLQIITKKLVYFTGSLLLIFLVIFYFLYNGQSDRTYLVLFVFMAGLLGGFVSIQQRLPKTGLSELRELSSSWFSILLVPVNGGIFAIVLMLMFVSGIIEGGMFPKYTEIQIDHSNLVASFSYWLKQVFPVTGPDVAKLMFWSFVAGFSERFVPQIIRKTTESAENNK